MKWVGLWSRQIYKAKIWGLSEIYQYQD